jgi:hypothetical protein
MPIIERRKNPRNKNCPLRCIDYVVYSLLLHVHKIKNRANDNQNTSFTIWLIPFCFLKQVPASIVCRINKKLTVGNYPKKQKGA